METPGIGTEGTALMPMNVVRKRPMPPGSQVVELPPVMVRIPDLDSPETDGPIIRSPSEDRREQVPTASEDGTARPGVEPTAENPISKQLTRILQVVDQPLVRQWGTKVGVVVGACLLLFVLYSIVGKRSDDDPPSDLGGQAASKSGVARADNAAKRARATGDKKPIPKKLDRAKAAAKFPPGSKPRPVNPAAGKRPGPPAKQPGPAGAQPKTPGQQQLAKQVPPYQPNQKAAPPAKPGVNPGQPAGSSVAAGMPPRPPAPASLQGQSAPPPAVPREREVVTQRDAIRDSQFNGGGSAVRPADGMRSAAAPHPGRNGVGTVAGRDYPSTRTPSALYARPDPVGSAPPIASAGYDRERFPERASSFGTAPPAMNTEYPRTDHPTEDYLRRRVATDAPAYRTSMRGPTTPRYDDRYDRLSQPGVARLQGTIESSPIRTNP